MATNTFFIYARKSTDDAQRQVRSIDDQIAELRELAAKERLTVGRVFVEKQTAKEPGRPVFNEMLTLIERGEASGILAWHPDRLARNSVDGGRVIYMVDTGRIKALKFYSVPFDPTPSGKFMLSILFGQSKYYVDNLAENIRRGQRQKLKNGIWPQFAPIGYLNDRATRTIAPDPDRAPLVRRAFELCANDRATLDDIKNKVNGLGLTTRAGKPLSRSQYHRLLRNPIYCGVIRYAGELYDGAHEPIITKGLFDRARDVIRDKRKTRRKGRQLKPYAFRGAFRCAGCGAAVTTETQKGHNYLRCTRRLGPCAQPFVREEEVARQTDSILAPIALPDAWVGWMRRALAEARTREAESNAERIAATRKAIDAAEGKLGRLTDAYLEGVLNVDEFRGRKAELVEERVRLTEKLRLTEQKPNSWFEPAERFLNALSEAVLCVPDGGTVEKAKLLKKLGSNLTVRDRRIVHEFNEPWKTVEKHGRFAQTPTAAPSGGAAAGGETDDVVSLAERGRFELP